MQISASIFDAEHMSARQSVLAAVNAAASRVGSLPEGVLATAENCRRRAAMPMSPVIEITYCRLCGWGLRAGWMAQELLTTFADELGSVTLTPDRTGGVFEVRVDDEVIWSRKERGRFPEIKEIKQLVRDRVAPGRSLGHTDTP
jgi:selenoprotein W-related protein